jgi:hypothetical protein
LTNAFHTHSGGISTFYMAMLHMANQQQREMRLIVPGAEDRVEQVGGYGRIYIVSAPRHSSAPWFASDGRAPVRKSYLGVTCKWCHP